MFKWKTQSVLENATKRSLDTEVIKDTPSILLICKRVKECLGVYISLCQKEGVRVCLFVTLTDFPVKEILHTAPYLLSFKRNHLYPWLNYPLNPLTDLQPLHLHLAIYFIWHLVVYHGWMHSYIHQLFIYTYISVHIHWTLRKKEKQNLLCCLPTLSFLLSTFLIFPLKS